MKEIGRVIKIKDKLSLVEVGGAYCNSCLSKEKCFFHREREKIVEAENSVNAKPGDLVLLDIASKKYIFITFIIYLIPVISMFIGALFGEYIFGKIYFKGENVSSIIFGFLFLILSILIIRLFNKFLFLRPKIEEILDENFLKNFDNRISWFKIKNWYIKFKEKSMGIEGNIKDFPLIDVLNLLSFGSKTGVLIISGKKNDEVLTGEIYFQSGKIVDAICGNKKGEEAFYSIFLMSEGNFTFKTQNINITPKIEKSFDNLLLEAIRKADEIKVLYSKIPDLNTILETNPNVEASEIRLSADEWQVLNLFKEKKSIKEALKNSPFSEFETLKSIYLLLSFNLLTKAEEVEIDLSKIVPKRVISPVKDALSILGLSQPKTACDKVLFKIDGVKNLQDIANELKLSKKEILSCFIKLLKETKIIANISLEKIKSIERLTKEE